MLLLLRYHVLYLQRTRARALGVGKYVKVRDVETFDKTTRTCEAFVGLSSRSNNEVNAYERMRYGTADKVDFYDGTALCRSASA